MHRGFSLVELLAASALLTTVLLMGYRYCDGQQALTEHALARTRPESESIYRMLLIRTIFSGASDSLDLDPILAVAPTVFPDLQFGQAPGDESFSVAFVTGPILPFVKQGQFLRVPGSYVVPGMILLIAGPGANENFDWDYVRVENVALDGEDQLLQTVSMAGRSLPLRGTLVPVEMHGIAYRNGALYLVQPSGLYSPILAIQDFRSTQEGDRLHLSWKAGPNTIAFSVKP